MNGLCLALAYYALQCHVTSQLTSCSYCSAAVFCIFHPLHVASHCETGRCPQEPKSKVMPGDDHPALLGSIVWIAHSWAPHPHIARLVGHQRKRHFGQARGSQLIHGSFWA